ncbi:MAG: FecR family protein [Xanthobacteraceae bacterium]
MRPSSRFIVALLGALFAAASASAQQVGTATAVNPLSESTPPGGTTGPLMVGAHIVHKERVHTTPAGTAQLLFTDKSSMSIAPNTDIVIDEYVYDPNANDGHMLVSLTKGALRFVGGQLSHQGEATITTSAANIGIRGGTVTVIQGQNGTKVINHYGNIKIVNGAGTFLLTRSDFGALIQNWNTLIQDLGRIPPAEVAFYQAAAMSKFNENGGVTGFTGANIGHCGLGSAQGTNCPQTPWMPTDGGELDATQILGNATNFGTSQNNPPPPPPPPRMRGR